MNPVTKIAAKVTLMLGGLVGWLVFLGWLLMGLEVSPSGPAILWFGITAVLLGAGVYYGCRMSYARGYWDAGHGEPEPSEVGRWRARSAQ